MSRRRAFLLACAAAYLAIAALYWPTVGLTPAPLDDSSQLAELALEPFSQVFARDRFGHVRPAKSALFWALSRTPDSIAAWRTALLVAFLASAALWQVLCTTLLKSSGWGSVATLCWVLNPTTLSTLCWLSTGNLVLALLGILAYLHLADRAVSVDSTPAVAVACSVGAIASLLVAVLSYQTAVFAPVLWFVHRRSLGDSLAPLHRRRVAALAVSSALCILVLGVLHLSQTTPATAYRFEQHPSWLLVLSAPRYLFENLRLWLWLPGRFGVLLSDEPAHHLSTSALGWLALIGAGALALRWSRRDPVMRVGLVWSAVFLLPLMNFVPLGNTPIAIQYLYLPGLGLALLFARAAQSAAVELRRRGRQRSSWLPALVLGLWIAAWLPEQPRVLAAWGDARTLYATTIANYPDNIEARVNLAAVYLDAHDYERADALLLESLRIAPSNAGLVANRFRLLASLGRIEEALTWQDAQPALNTPEAWVTRGMLLEQRNRHADAVVAYRRAFEAAAQPEERFSAGYHLAMALVRIERLAEAEVWIDRLLAEFPDRPELLFSKRLLMRTR